MNILLKYMYGLGVRGYYLLILLVSPFHWKAKQYITGRKNWFSKLEKEIDSKRKRVWFHAPSIGEYQECRKFVREFCATYPEYQFVFTFESPSGYDQANIPVDDAIRLLLPLDTKSSAKKFIELVQPEKHFVLASDIWLNYLAELDIHNIERYFVSFHGREESSFFSKTFRSFFEPALAGFTHVFCYDQKGCDLMKENFGYENTTVVGNLRYDCVIDRLVNLRELDKVKEFVGDSFCFVAGSTETKEDELIIEAFKKLKDLDMKWVIVPHEKIPTVLNALHQSFDGNSTMLSTDFDPTKKVLIIDKTGDLFHMYQYADVANVGRGFHRLEIHNMMEPQIFEIPVLIGPKHKKFPEPIRFIKEKVAFEFNTSNELADYLSKIYHKELVIDKQVVRSIFDENEGGVTKIMDYLKTKAS